MMTLEEIKKLNEEFEKNCNISTKYYGTELLTKNGKHIGVDLMLNEEGLELQVSKVVDYDRDNKVWETFAFEDININKFRNDEELNKYLDYVIDIYESRVKNDIDEEGFVINREGAKLINGMVYKGIYVQYLYDTNTLLFTIHNEDNTYDDSDDIDTLVYRNYTRNEVEKHIDNLIKNFIDEKKAKKVYHLKNTYNDHDEYTTDENKILMIYIDELAQCVDNHLTINNFGEYEYKNATGWLYEIMTLCGKYNRGKININEIIEKLNKEHNWCIEVEIKREEE